MISTPIPLPDYIEILKRLLVDRDALIAKLMTEIARLKRWQFRRSSERLDTTLAQLQLALDDLQSVPALDEVSPTTTTPPLPAAESTQEPPEKRVLPLRRAPRAFPAHLPRETIVHDPTSCNCPDCGAAMRKLGEDVSELLDMVPGYFKVVRHVRPKLSCGHCSRIVKQPAPPRPIARSMAAPGLLAQIIVAKYADHCPLYRQQGIYRRSGVELDRATLASWVGETARLLEPLVDVLGRYVLAAEKVHADDTPRTCVTSAAFCRLTPTPDSGRCTRTGRSWKRHAGRTRGASSTTSTWWIARLLRPRPCSASLRCTRSSATFAAPCRSNAPACGRSAPGRSTSCSSGCRRRCFLEAIRNPAHEEHAEMLEWCGGAFDPAAFRPDDINTAFRDLKL